MGACIAAHIHLASTNDELHELARAGAPEGIVLVAKNQTANRGTLTSTVQGIADDGAFSSTTAKTSTASSRPMK